MQNSPWSQRAEEVLDSLRGTDMDSIEDRADALFSVLREPVEVLDLLLMRMEEENFLPLLQGCIAEHLEDAPNYSDTLELNGPYWENNLAAQPDWQSRRDWGPRIRTRDVLFMTPKGEICLARKDWNIDDLK